MKKLFVFCLFFIGLFWALASYGGLATQGKYDSLILDFREEVSQAEIDRTLQAIATQFKLKPQPNSIFSQADRIYVLKGNADLLEQLKKSDLSKLTEYIEPNYTYSLDFIGDGKPNDPLYSKQWNLHSINVETAWQQTRGKGITVAVIDTGISQVEDLKDTKFVNGYDFVNDREQADDDNGHGTHVAGTIAQATNNKLGVAGIAYEANLMPLKVLSSWGGGTVADIAEAIRFAADRGADVINMSLGGGGESSLMQEAINYAHQKGVVIVAAAGNSSNNAAAYPARYPRVIGVSAIGPSGTKASYSNYGAGVDIAAPGGVTRSAKGDEDPSGGILQNTIDPKTGESVFRAYQGTSMASPHIAGVAALVKASGIKQPDEVLNILKQSARKVEEDGLNYYGAGQIDAAAAVQLATKGQISFPDFFRWLRDNGYLNPRFWVDGGAVALLPKTLMVIGSYLLAWLLRNFFPFRWNWSFANGLFMGSIGLFFLRGFYVFDLPQFPFRIIGSSLPELGTAIQTTNALNPITASVLFPLALLVFLLGHREWKWFAIGSTIGVSACLGVHAFFSPHLIWLGEGLLSSGFLIVNALLCFGLAYLSLKSEVARA
ncbi:S8 family peptidase [Tumidithrix helvetica PCC 7403]|uniref:S8 family peptidase n=1 Tax=Tumidithrix helvetica TaxID=3457545 RepID=UPI003C8FA78B